MSDPQIESPRNPRIQAARRLRERAHRQEAGLFLLDAPHLIDEGLAAGLRWAEVYYDARRAGEPAIAGRLERLAQAGARLVPVAPRVVDVLAEADTPQGVVAVAHLPPPLRGPDDLLARAPARVVAFDGVQDPVNVGAVLRSARAFGAGAVALGRGSADPFHPRALRAGAGAALHLARLEADLAPVLAALGGAGYARLGLDPHAGVPPEELAGIARAALVVGAEGRGLSPEVRRELDGLVRIPMQPGVESLNAAVAAAIALYVLRPRPPAGEGGVGADPEGVL